MPLSQLRSLFRQTTLVNPRCHMCRGASLVNDLIGKSYQSWGKNMWAMTRRFIHYFVSCTSVGVDDIGIVMFSIIFQQNLPLYGNLFVHWVPLIWAAFVMAKSAHICRKTLNQKHFNI